MKNPTPFYTILMPCLNETETLASCIRKAKQSLNDLDIQGEVLIADNGSTDGSQELARSLGARVVDIPQKGYGWALRGGIEAAAGQFIIMADSDDSYDFSNLRPFVEKLQAGHELVMGCRMPWGGGTVLPGAMPWKHFWIGNPALTFIGKMFFHSPCNDFHCGLRGFTKAAYLEMDLRTTGMELASEMVIKATLQDMKITEVPITLHPDGRSRPPHLRSWRDGWRHLRFMLLFSPDWIFFLPASLGFIGALAGITLGYFGSVSLLGARLTVGTQIVSLFLFLISYMCLSAWFLAKLYGQSAGLFRARGLINLFIPFFTLEKGLFLGLSFIGLGLAVFITSFWKWFQAGFGAVPIAPNISAIAMAMTFIAAGINTLLTSFSAGIITLPRSKTISTLLQPSENK